MYFRLAADAVLVAHVAFVLFVILGGTFAARWPWFAFAHIPAAAWGVFVELAGRICPLTYLENYLRILAGQSGYSDSFIEHYLLPVVYPAGLTREIQLALALAVVAANLAIYGALLLRWRASHRSDA
ncbi:MAG: DUF2784 domain-containing protein [Steroidobacteraceae bacterium]